MTDSKSPSDPGRSESRRLGRVRAAGLAAALAAAALVAQLGGTTPGQRVFDLYQQLAPRARGAGPSVAQVVLIDPRSLREVGPWPWPRYVVARLTEGIAARGAVAIGFDVIFPESDRFNPEHMASFFPELSPAAQAELAALPSMDTTFADVLGRHPVVLPRVGVAPSSDDYGFAFGRDAASLPVEARFGGPVPDAVLSYPRALTNIPDLDEVAAGQALINGPPDADGIVRRVPLIGKVAGIAMPGFALELARLGQNEERIDPIVSGGRLRAVRLGRRTIPVDREGRMALRFGAFPDTSVASAVSVFQRGFPADAFKGKIVLVGLAAATATDVVATPLDPQYYGVYVQAQAVNAILSGAVLSRPWWAPPLEWTLAAASALLAVFLFPMLRRRAAVAVPVAIAPALVAGSWAAFASAGLLLDPVAPLVVGGAAGAAVLVTLFNEGARTQRRLRESLEDERLAGARAAGELEAAREIQLGMLPPRDRLAGLHPALDLDAMLEPARAVGGDFFDAMRLDDGRVCFLVGDVTGKGVPAALFMALSKALTKSVLLREAGDLGLAVRMLDREIARDNAEDMFVTMLVGVIDLATGEVALCNAGHENPLRIAADGSVAAVPMDGGPPLCVVDDFPYVTEPIRLAPGEALVVVTDGVTEAQDAAGELFGRAALATLLARWRGGAADANAAIIEAVRAFEGGSEPSDDVTVLALRYLGAVGATDPED